jgi:uncharacterized protein (TIGR02466 family)
MVKNIFSVPIYVKKDYSFLEESKNLLSEIKIEEYYEPNLYGVSGFTTYFKNDVSSKIISKLPNTVNFIETNADLFLKGIGYNLEGYEVKVKSMWFSRMKEYSAHSFHIHSVLGDKIIMACGTYYLDVAETSSPITFSRSEGEFFNQPDLPVAVENSYTQRFFEHQPESGDLVLFLSETFHGVMPSKYKSNRDTLSFNISVIKNAT